MNKKIFFPILILIGLVLPIVASAQLTPLVICGTKASGRECTLCDIFLMLQKVLNFIWWILLIIAPLFIIAGGIMILTAGIKPSQLEDGKRIITGTIVGLIIALLSWTILNMIFNALANQESEGFPWPWNQIQCTGGGVAQTQPCNNDSECPTGRYCDYYSTNRCVPAESLVCIITNECPPGYSCPAGKCVRNVAPGGNYCCCNFPDNTVTCDQLLDSAACNDECLSHCQAFYPGFNNSCCRNEAGRCSTTATGRCGQMSPPGACTYGLSEYQCLVGVNDQLKDASTELLLLLNCMARSLPQNDRIISSITDNSGGACFYTWITQCPINTDSCEGSCCGHMQNSLHYGGTGCRGTSYAVDIGVIVSSTIGSIASACAQEDNLGEAQVINEGNHIHIELDGLARQNHCL